MVRFSSSEYRARGRSKRDLEVTMDVVPANASAGAAGEIKLPFTLPQSASDRGREASAFGQDTASKAHELKGDLGRDFGQGVSEAARARDHAPNLRRNPGAP